MANAANNARARRIAEKIRSGRTKDGAYGVYARIRTEEYIDALAERIAGTYPNFVPDDEELRRIVLSHETRHPDKFWTSPQITANLRSARQKEAEQIPIRDFTRQVLMKMNPVERLQYIDAGIVPQRFKLLKPGEDA